MQTYFQYWDKIPKSDDRLHKNGVICVEKNLRFQEQAVRIYENLVLTGFGVHAKGK